MFTSNQQPGFEKAKGLVDLYREADAKRRGGLTCQERAEPVTRRRG